MSTFGSFKDSPVHEIRTEGQEISLNLTKTSPTTARVSWNIPTPFDGCTDGNQTYNGIVVTLDTTPSNVRKSPVRGKKYTADPTADVNLHAGDKIDSALVIGAFYDDKETTFFDVTGLDPDTPYYVSAHAVDNVLRYHLEGVHAYWTDYGNQEKPDTNGYQIIEMLVDGTDTTGLLPTTDYSFKIDIDDRALDHPTKSGTSNQPPPDHSNDPVITVNGSNAVTYDDLIVELNKQFALLDSIPQSAGAPNTGAYYWSGLPDEQLLQWDGSTYNQLDVIIQGTDPTITSVNAFWSDTDDHILYKYNGTTWDVQPNVIDYHIAPTEVGCSDFWKSPTNVYRWDGTVWKLKTLWNQTNDPSLSPSMDCPFYWYDENNQYLYAWSTSLNGWEIVDPIMWAMDPTVVSLNDYWFNTETSLVMQWDGSTWIDVPSTISATQPTLPMPDMLWFDIENEELFKYNDGTSTWDSQDIKVSSFEPNNPPTAGLWWNTTTNQINVWDVTTNSWAVSLNFVESTIDPSLPPVLTADEDIWYNGDKLYNWDGSGWVEVTFIEYPTDPTNPAPGDYWYNTANGVYSEWDGTSWNEITLTKSKEDPYTPAAGDFWFDSSTSTLSQWSGVAWIGLLYSTTPYTPAIGDRYFDTSTNKLMEWNGEWIEAHAKVTASLVDGNLRLDSTKVGSSSAVSVVNETDSGFLLFDSLVVGLENGVNIKDPVFGTDGLDPQPTYMQVGVGDDGSPDERRELIDSIRAQLGYPVIDVELTKYQWDQCINSAIEELRLRSSSAYKRAYFFIDLEAGKQIYDLTNERVGFNKIVSVMEIYRTQSSFLGTAEGQGVYGQLMLQHLYQMGTFDLVSFHLVNEYVETMGHMFAQGIQYDWNEDTRQLVVLQALWRHERVLLDAVIERSEQELLKDRFLKNWLERWATAEACLVLSEIRGKYAGLPGAGGGIALNAADLTMEAEKFRAECYEMLDNWVADNKEHIGMASDFIIG